MMMNGEGLTTSMWCECSVAVGLCWMSPRKGSGPVGRPTECLRAFEVSNRLHTCQQCVDVVGGGTLGSRLILPSRGLYPF
jgi:hypothetical protein